MTTYRFSIAVEANQNNFCDTLMVRAKSQERAETKVRTHLREVFGLNSRITYLRLVDKFPADVSPETSYVLACQAKASVSNRYDSLGF